MRERFTAFIFSVLLRLHLTLFFMLKFGFWFMRVHMCVCMNFSMRELLMLPPMDFSLGSSLKLHKNPVSNIWSVK